MVVYWYHTVRICWLPGYVIITVSSKWVVSVPRDEGSAARDTLNLFCLRLQHLTYHNPSIWNTDDIFFIKTRFPACSFENFKIQDNTLFLIKIHLEWVIRIDVIRLQSQNLNPDTRGILMLLKIHFRWKNLSLCRNLIQYLKLSLISS